jgi:hypothetical protein
MKSTQFRFGNQALHLSGAEAVHFLGHDSTQVVKRAKVFTQIPSSSPPPSQQKISHIPL